MGKNIVLCCDGTNNQFDSDRTNVMRTSLVAQRNAQQLVYYDPGVGTMASPWSTSKISKRIEMINGLVFGADFETHIENGYKYMMEVWEPGDKVYLFGFSRGAYTARALAGMLKAVGLLPRGQNNLFPYAKSYWLNFLDENSKGVCKLFKSTQARTCPVHFIGVWDTVSSVGMYNHSRSYPYTFHNPEVKVVRHAVSIDERRAAFRENLMAQVIADHPMDQQDVLNVWFAGVHSDVGGGYPLKECGMAKVPFEWMMCEAKKTGMLIDGNLLKFELEDTGQDPSPSAELHKSLVGGWWIVEFLWRRRYSFKTKSARWYWTVNEPRDLTDRAEDVRVALHRSVIDRYIALPDYRPKNFPTTGSEMKKSFGSIVETTA